MFNDPLSPARNIDLRQIVYEKIKEAIVGGFIRPGERLSEVELADKLAVSRTPVREAIRQLAQTGLVTLEPRRGAFVSLPTVRTPRTCTTFAPTWRSSPSAGDTLQPIEELERWRPVFSVMTDETDGPLPRRGPLFHASSTNCRATVTYHDAHNIADLSTSAGTTPWRAPLSTSPTNTWPSSTPSRRGPDKAEAVLRAISNVRTGS